MGAVKGKITRLAGNGRVLSDERHTQIAPSQLATTPAYPGGPRMVRARVGEPLEGKRVKRVGTAPRQGMTGSIGMGNAGSEQLGLE